MNNSTKHTMLGIVTEAFGETINNARAISDLWFSNDSNTEDPAVFVTIAKEETTENAIKKFEEAIKKSLNLQLWQDEEDPENYASYMIKEY